MAPEVQQHLMALIVGLVSWLIKNVIFKQRNERVSLIVAEHRKRLEDVWSPPHFYTGLILMDSTRVDKWCHPGVREIQKIMEKSAHIIPSNHFQMLVKLLEGRTEQNTGTLDIEDFRSTKLYFIKQIQICDYIVFKKYIDFNPILETSKWPSFSSLLRQLNGVVISLMIWAAIASIFYFGAYLVINSIYWPLMLLFILWAIIFIRDIYLRVKRDKFFRDK